MFTSIEGQESSIPKVTEELEKNEWAHLARHGLPDKSHPFESASALQDGWLTIQQISQLEVKHAEFAYLSACHTMVRDEESPDGSLHLAAATQFAGFRSVIGTMWAVDDAQANKIASMFYKFMVDESGRLDHTRAAYALWRTMRWPWVGCHPINEFSTCMVPSVVSRICSVSAELHKEILRHQRENMSLRRFGKIERLASFLGPLLSVCAPPPFSHARLQLARKPPEGRVSVVPWTGEPSIPRLRQGAAPSRCVLWMLSFGVWGDRTTARAKLDQVARKVADEIREWIVEVRDRKG